VRATIRALISLREQTYACSAIWSAPPNLLELRRFTVCRRPQSLFELRLTQFELRHTLFELRLTLLNLDLRATLFDLYVAPAKLRFVVSELKRTLFGLSRTLFGLRRTLLKGQCHEILDLWFFS
jgi:hypothetical protein